MNKTEQLNELFQEWKQKVKISENKYNKDVFIKDGIIDLDTFENQRKKVLFISNEANIEGHQETNDAKAEGCQKSDVDYDNRVEFQEYKTKKIDSYYNSRTKKEEMSKGRMRERVCCLYQVIINDFSNKNTPYELAGDFAFMNLNKTGGKAHIDDRIIKFCCEFNEQIKKEIDIINPDLIVWLGCNTLDNKNSRNCLEVKKDRNGRYFYKDNVPVIRMWHTSYHQSKCQPLGKFDNKIVDKLAYKLSTELKNIEQ